MIQANELRIGNWVFMTGGYIQITSVDSTGINRTEDCNGDKSYYTTFPGPVGIPLTPEILEKAGFKKYQWQEAYYIQTYFGCLYIHFYNGRIITRFMSISKDSRGDKSFSLPFIGNKKSSENYIYLHHIQNLLYELTQTELNINL